ncbi:uncharacterized protein YukE [Streptacidiphilus sp. MAP12-16]|uniref:WXG100 family type VII secretion target n=1 Tax=Streptacidiphilus sp. MAP12-16 TaxID=3156300 RepID=UPI0035139FFE
MAGGIGDEAVAAYNWINTPLFTLPVQLPDIHKMESGAVDGLIDSGVREFLKITGLQDLLDMVTGRPEELHAAGAVWLDQAKTTRDICGQLQSGGRALQPQWDGQASGAFGTFMGNLFQQLESMAQDMSQTAEILNNAGQECQLAEDMIVMIIREAIEWYLMDLAATAVADIFTLGLATFVGAAAATAEAAVFIERATKVCTTLGKVLEDLQKMLKDLKAAGEAVKAAKGFKATYGSFKAAQELTKGFRTAGSIFKVGKDAEYSWSAYRTFKIGNKIVTATAGTALGGLTGLPTAVGKSGIAKDIGAGAKDQLTGDGGLAVTARAIDGATGTGTPTPAPYRLPDSSTSSLRDKLDALTTFANPVPKPAGEH